MECDSSMTPSEYLMDRLPQTEDAEMVLIVIRHKDKGISFGTNDNRKFTAYALASIAAAYTQADLLSEEVKEILSD